MHRATIWLAAALLATPAVAWETKVRDSRGQRVVELYGFAEGSEVHGLVISCHPAAEGAFVGLGFAIPPTNEFEMAPGAAVVLQLSALSLDAEIIANDSDGAVALVEDPELSAIAAAIGYATSLEAGIAGLGSPIYIPNSDWDESYRLFVQACGL